MADIVLVITTALISGLLATVITICWQRHAQIKQSKMNVFETLMAYRYMVASEESVKALNSIDVIFYKDNDVRAAYKDFLNEADKKPELNPNIADKHLKLLEEMSKVLKLGEIHWDDIKRAYYPTGLSEKMQEEALLRKMQIQSAAAAIQHSAAQSNTLSSNQFAQQRFAQIFPELMGNPAFQKELLDVVEKYGGQK